MVKIHNFHVGHPKRYMLRRLQATAIAKDTNELLGEHGLEETRPENGT